MNLLKSQSEYLMKGLTEITIKKQMELGYLQNMERKGQDDLMQIEILERQLADLKESHEVIMGDYKKAMEWEKRNGSF